MDAEYGGRDDSRRSTSGGALKLGRHIVKSRVVTQQVVALSAGGAAPYGVVEDAGVLIGAISMMHDFGLSVEGVLRAVSSAAKGIVSWRRLWEVKHIDVRNM